MNTLASTLPPEQVQALAADLRAIEIREKAALDKGDIRYIRKVLRAVLILEIAGRGLLFLGFNPFAWIAGVAFLAVSKIIENTEIGHNVMHGQYDWTGDAALKGNTYEFDVVATSDNWRSGHNVDHHHNTGVQGLDNDVGLLRFSSQQTWRWYHLFQLPFALFSALFAQWGVAVQNLRLGDFLQGKVERDVFWRERVIPLVKKSLGRLLKDYVVFPLLAGPFFLNVLLGNLAANALRNIWVWLVIAAGHCVGGVRIYQQEELQGTAEEHWYIRQITSSANFSSGPALRILTGHLGYHIEHHLFPDLPARRYPRIAGEIRQLCRRHGLAYNDRSFMARVGEVLYRLTRFSLPPRANAGKS